LLIDLFIGAKIGYIYVNKSHIYVKSH